MLVITTKDRKPPRKVGGGLDDPEPQPRPTPKPSPRQTASDDQALAAARNQAEIARRDAADARAERDRAVAELGATRRQLDDARARLAAAERHLAATEAEADGLRTALAAAGPGIAAPPPARYRAMVRVCPEPTPDELDWAAEAGTLRPSFWCRSCGREFWVRRHAEAHIEAGTWAEPDVQADGTG